MLNRSPWLPQYAHLNKSRLLYYCTSLNSRGWVIYFATVQEIVCISLHTTNIYVDFAVHRSNGKVQWATVFITSLCSVHLSEVSVLQTVLHLKQWCLKWCLSYIWSRSYLKIPPVCYWCRYLMFLKEKKDNVPLVMATFHKGLLEVRENVNTTWL